MMIKKKMKVGIKINRNPYLFFYFNLDDDIRDLKRMGNQLNKLLEERRSFIFKSKHIKMDTELLLCIEDEIESLKCAIRKEGVHI